MCEPVIFQVKAEEVIRGGDDRCHYGHHQETVQESFEHTFGGVQDVFRISLIIKRFLSYYQKDEGQDVGYAEAPAEIL